MLVAAWHITVTVSGGCALGPADAPDELIRAADTRLYHAKVAGQNRILAADLHSRV